MSKHHHLLKVSKDESEEEEYKIESVSKKDGFISIQKLEQFALQNSVVLDHVKQIESLRLQVMRKKRRICSDDIREILKIRLVKIKIKNYF